MQGEDKRDRTKVRMARLLIYEGERWWVEHTLEKSSVPLNGTTKVPTGGKIRSLMLDDFPEVIDEMGDEENVPEEVQEVQQD